MAKLSPRLSVLDWSQAANLSELPSPSSEDQVVVVRTSGVGRMSVAVLQAALQQQVAAQSAALAGKADLNAYDRASHSGTQAATTVLMANGNTLEAEIARLLALIAPGGATAPTIDVAPTLSFPGGSGDVGETMTITGGAVSGAYTSMQYRLFAEATDVGVVAGSVGTPSTVTVQAAWAQTATRVLRAVQEVTWPGGVVTRSSATAVLNAVAAVPAPVTNPSISGTLAVGQQVTLAAGAFSNGPITSYHYSVYGGGPSGGGGSLVYATSNAAASVPWTVPDGMEAATLVLEVTADNAAGSGTVRGVSAGYTVSGGAAPSWDTANGAILPGFVPAVGGVYQSGARLSVDVGQPLNNASPTGWSYYFRRNGVAIPGASGGNVAAAAIYYDLVAADVDQIVGCVLTPSNAAGVGAAAYLSGVLVRSGAGGGEGGAAVFVGASTSGGNGVTGLTLTPHASAQNGDLMVLVATVNVGSGATIDAPGWTPAIAQQVQAAPEGQTTRVYSRVYAGEASFAITFGLADAGQAAIAFYRGPSGVVAAAAPTIDSGANSSPVSVTFPGATSAAPNQTHVLVNVFDATSSVSPSWSDPSGYTPRVNTALDFSSGFGAIYIADAALAAAGASGSKSGTAALAATAGWMAVSLVLG
ncbi:MAG: hypothetical protein HS128_19260 [Ideonella sp.]|nr:hypothetical protein [Ideonella sp.]MCC7455970.1 hypothetical protein [Nitrospira sp.]